jgi:hypothetical protein
VSALRARTVALEELTESDHDRWAELVDRALEPNPFLSPAYLASAVRHLPSARDIHAVVVEDAGAMRAFLPLSRARRFAGTPLPYATTAGPFLGSESPLCVPLIDEDRPTEVLGALLDHLASRASGLPGLVELTLVPVGGRFDEALENACRARGVPLVERYRFERAALVPAAGGPAPREALSTSRRKQVERLRRRLERAVGPLEMTDAGLDPAAFDAFVRLEAAGWKGTTEEGGALQVVPGALEWFTDVADDLRSRGRLHLFTLTAGDEVVFVSVVLRAGDRLYSLMDTYDERFAKFSPGSIGRVAEQEHVLEHTDATLFDPCLHPRHTVPTGLYRDRRTLRGVVIAPRGTVGRALLRHSDGLRALVTRAGDAATRVRDTGARLRGRLSRTGATVRPTLSTTDAGPGSTSLEQKEES